MNEFTIFLLQVQMQCWHESFAILKETGSVIAGVHIEESQVKEKVRECDLT